MKIEIEGIEFGKTYEFRDADGFRHVGIADEMRLRTTGPRIYLIGYNRRFRPEELTEVVPQPAEPKILAPEDIKVGMKVARLGPSSYPCLGYIYEVKTVALPYAVCYSAPCRATTAFDTRDCELFEVTPEYEAAMTGK